MSRDSFSVLKVSEMKKSAPAVKGGEEVKASGGNETGGTTSEHRGEASSSSSFPEELQGFTSASEMYSVRSHTHFS